MLLLASTLAYSDPNIEYPIDPLSLDDIDLRDIPQEHLKQFIHAYSIIKNNYVKELSDDNIIENAIRGIFIPLDPHSEYLDQHQYQTFRSNTKGHFGGIGIEVTEGDEALKVLSPIDNTPAHQAGILAGDSIIKINDRFISEFKKASPLDSLNGPPGTPVTLTIVRDNHEQPIEFKLNRAVIKIESVTHQTLQPNVGYVRIAQFQSDTATSLQQSLASLMHENNNIISGLVVDLRNNPGGTLSGAIDVADLFLNSGIIVTVEDRVNKNKKHYEASSASFLPDSKIVILVNKGSASAAEIVSGALQKNKRATIIGAQTFGKGSVQTLFPLNFESALKITTAKYFLADGQTIDKVGISPDISVPESKQSTSGVDIYNQYEIQLALDYFNQH